MVLLVVDHINAVTLHGYIYRQYRDGRWLAFWQKPGDTEIRFAHEVIGQWRIDALNLIADLQNKLPGSASCPRDTDGDGNCGNRSCPICWGGR